MEEAEKGEVVHVWPRRCDARPLRCEEPLCGRRRSESEESVLDLQWPPPPFSKTHTRARGGGGKCLEREVLTEKQERVKRSDSMKRNTKLKKKNISENVILSVSSFF